MKSLIAAFAAAGIIAAHGAAYAWTETLAAASPAPAKSSPKPAADLKTWESCATCLKTTLPSPLPDGAAAFSAGQNMAVPGDQFAIAISKPKTLPSALPDPRLGFSGGETDVAILYAAPLDEKTTGVVSLSIRRDADGISGQRDTAGIIQLKRSF